METTFLPGLKRLLLKEDIASVKQLHQKLEEARSGFGKGKLGLLLICLAAGGLFFAVRGHLANFHGNDQLYQVLAGVAVLIGAGWFFHRLSAKNAAQKTFREYTPKVKIREVRVGSLKVSTCRGGLGDYLFNRSGYTRPVALEFYAQSNVDKLKGLLTAYDRLVSSMPAVLESGGKNMVKVVEGLEHPIYSEESELYQVLRQMCGVLEDLECRKESYPLLHLAPEQLGELLRLSREKSPDFPSVESPTNAEVDLHAVIRQIEGCLASTILSGLTTIKMAG